MPNGSDKNWIRLLGALDGFFEDTGHWPTWVRMPKDCLENLRNHVLGPEGFAAVNKKVTIIPDDVFAAEDHDGNSYDYGSRGFPNSRPNPDARTWLGVEPNH